MQPTRATAGTVVAGATVALLAIVALPLSIALMFLNMELAVQVPAVGGLSILTGWCTLRFSNRAAPGIQPQTRLDPS